jgi:hypothetical protein
MSRLPTSLYRLLVGVLVALSAGGCQLPSWKPHDLAQLRGARSTPSSVDRSDRDMGLAIVTASQAAHDKALTDVMHEIQQIGASNPAAQQKLLDELAQSKPELWPLAVQQFRSSLAYHDQLVASQQPAGAQSLAVAKETTANDRASYVWPSEPLSAVQANFQTPADLAGAAPRVETALLTTSAPPVAAAPALPTAALSTHTQPPAEQTTRLPKPAPADNATDEAPQRDLLELHKLTFCKEVYGFGAYEPYESNRFKPAEQVSLYVELANYRSEPTKDGFLTRLGATYQILDEHGERVDGGEFPDVEDRCRSRRRDFHIQYGLVLPDKIAPGKYRLRLALRDRQSDHVGQSTIDFEIKP